MTRVLLVDDDTELVALLAEYLEQEGFEVDAVHCGSQGVRSALQGDYAIVVLDVMLPRVDGLEALERIRQRSRVPVLMLTGRGDDMDRITGLELGADDYVPKPCTPRELTARLRSILRRVEPDAPAVAPAPVIRVGSLVMWPERRRAECAGRELTLTGSEFNLLQTLASEAGQIVSKDALSRRALGRAVAAFDRSIDVHISSIRHKLAAAGAPHLAIQAVRRMGYQLLRHPA